MSAASVRAAAPCCSGLGSETCIVILKSSIIFINCFFCRASAIAARHSAHRGSVCCTSRSAAKRGAPSRTASVPAVSGSIVGACSVLRWQQARPARCLDAAFAGSLRGRCADRVCNSATGSNHLFRYDRGDPSLTKFVCCRQSRCGWSARKTRLPKSNWFLV